MKLPNKEPRAVLESFKDWLNKGERKGVLKPARHEHFPKPETQTGVTPAFYTERLYRVFFNELQRVEPDFVRCGSYLTRNW